MVDVDIVIYVGLIAAFTSMDFGIGGKVVFQNIGSCSLHSVRGHASVLMQCGGRCTFCKGPCKCCHAMWGEVYIFRQIVMKVYGSTLLVCQISRKNALLNTNCLYFLRQFFRDPRKAVSKT